MKQAVLPVEVAFLKFAQLQHPKSLYLEAISCRLKIRSPIRDPKRAKIFVGTFGWFPQIKIQYPIT
ncbi:MAG: hypothetical protein CMJ72_02125 [Planctomycetaceae bacterium]|nr:hypothetical protein [Planctomycetaceae bacterium]HCK41196.1 hypothetical protein [Planctomycetaceae bacterium]